MYHTHSLSHTHTHSHTHTEKYLHKLDMDIKEADEAIGEKMRVLGNVCVCVWVYACVEEF